MKQAINEETLTRHLNTPHSVVGKAEEEDVCDVCKGTGMVTELHEDEETTTVCPDCYEEDSNSYRDNLENR